MKWRRTKKAAKRELARMAEARDVDSFIETSKLAAAAADAAAEGMRRMAEGLRRFAKAGWSVDDFRKAGAGRG